MQSLTQFEGFTPERIKAIIHMTGGSRKVAFRYELLDKNDNRIGDLSTVSSGEVSHSSLSQIKRTARFNIKDSGDIDFLSDRIKPFARLHIPPGRILAREYSFIRTTQPILNNIRVAPNEGGWVEFPLGVFLLSSPTRKDQNNNVYREVEAFDGTVILRDDKFHSRYHIPAGANYRQAVIDILLTAGISKHNIEQTDKILPVDVEFEPGTEKLKAVNQLLSAINYTPIHVDVNGFFISFVYRSPSIRPAEYIYKDDELSITYPGMVEELDLFNIPNKWTVVLSNPEREPLVSTYTNDNPNSPTSTINRGRTILDYREIDHIADQESLDAYVQKLAFEASQVYGKVEFETAINPIHDYFDVIELDYSPLGIKGKYTETSWILPLESGGRMKHSVRRVITI
jgi:hypothetical protein